MQENPAASSGIIRLRKSRFAISWKKWLLILQTWIGRCKVSGWNCPLKKMITDTEFIWEKEFLLYVELSSKKKDYWYTLTLKEQPSLRCSIEA